MHKLRPVWLAAVLMIAGSATVAQQNPPHAATSFHPGTRRTTALAAAPKLPVDAQIAAALKDVSAARVKATIEKLVSFNNRNSNGSRDPELAKKGQGVVAAREWIRSEFERYSQACGGCLEVKTDRFTQPKSERVSEPTEMVNVYAVLRGTDPELSKRFYLVTGHYDSIAISRRQTPATGTQDVTASQFSGMEDWNAFAPGANDDASGTAVSIECARVLSKHKFPASIIFLTVPGEEQGLDGSAHFAKMAQEEKWELLGVLNNDIVGGDTTPGDTEQNKRIVRVFSEGVPLVATLPEVRRIRTFGWESDSASRELARYVNAVGRAYLLPGFAPEMIFRADRFGRGGDHTSFNRYGFAAVRITEYHENPDHQHLAPHLENGKQIGDLPQFVDFNYVANVARVNAATLASLASAPGPPDKASIDARGQQTPTNLSWEAAPGAASYEVVWRDTTAPDWEHAKDVGNVTKVTMPYSKDNVIYGVRSVDAKGHRSLVVLPKPPTGRAPAYEGPAQAPQPPTLNPGPGM